MLFFGKNKNKKVIQFTEQQINELKNQPRWLKGFINIFNHNFHFHDAICFYDSYQEIIRDEIYKFKPVSSKPVIIDCGANMGVSVLYFATEYPTATIIAFEPEDDIYKILEENIASFKFTNVSLQKKAVWDKETKLEFFTDHGMGGSVANVFKKQQPLLVTTVRLADYLQQPIDFLKIDIEGAEYTVLKDCEPYLKNVKNIFVEYHSFVNKEQKLEEILLMLKQNNFRYHLKQSFSQRRPFVDKVLACENMDMAINIFAYKEMQY